MLFLLVVAHLDNLFEDCDHRVARFVLAQQVGLGGEFFEADFERDLEDLIHIAEVAQHILDLVVLVEHLELALLFIVHLHYLLVSGELGFELHQIF